MDAVCTFSAASVMASVFSSTPMSAEKASIAEIPMGTDLVGRTITFFSVSSEACCAARMMLVLLGRMNTFLAWVASTAWARS